LKQPKLDLAAFARNPIAFVDAMIPLNEKGKPWSLAPYQRRVLALVFTWIMVAACESCVGTCVGHLAMRLLLWSEVKKSGKSFMAALLVLWWAFTHPETELVVTANDLEQIQGRIYRTIVALLKHNPTLGRSATVTATEIRLTNGTIITAIGADYKGAAGSRHSLYVIDEPWGIMHERAVRLVEELTPPPTEPDAFGLMTTTAGWTGESNLLEGLYRRGLSGERLDDELELYRTDELTMFWSHTPRQPWHTKKYLAEQRASSRDHTYLRLWENRFVAADSVFLTPTLWDQNVDPTHAPL
jgi:hypothetical protein